MGCITREENLNKAHCVKVKFRDMVIEILYVSNRKKKKVTD